MNILEVKTEKAPKAIGPYSQAIIAGDFVYTSGQLPLDPKTGEIVAENIEGQAKQVFENLKEVLEEAGSDLHHIVKATCYLKDLKDFANLNAVYAEYTNGDCFPARSAFEVSRLPKDVRVEIEVVAVRK